MRIKLIAYDHSIKGLDIDLFLEKPTRKKVAAIVKVINDSLQQVERNLQIPDDADVVRTDLHNVEREERKELKQDIKYGNRDDIFVFMNAEDQIQAIIKDYEILFSSSEADDLSYNINDFLRTSHYFLKIEADDASKPEATRSKRREEKEGSTNFQRERRIVSRKELIDWEIEKLVPKLEQLYKTSLVVESRKSKERPPLINLIQKRVERLEEQDVISLGATNNDRFAFVESVEPDEERENAYKITYSVRPFLDPKDIIETKVANLLGDQTLDVGELNLEEDDLEEDFYEEIAPKNINWEKMIRSGQSFPSSLFLDNSASTRALRKDWEDAVKFIKNENRTDTEQTQKEAFGKALTKGNLGDFKSLIYIDKSGYEVDLSKYFPALLALPPKVPQEVKERYEKYFKEIERVSLEVTELVKEAVERGDWEQVNNLSTGLRRRNPKRFNETFEEFLQPETFRRGNTSQRQALSELDKYYNDFKKSLKEFLGESVEINLDQ